MRNLFQQDFWQSAWLFTLRYTAVSLSTGTANNLHPCRLRLPSQHCKRAAAHHYANLQRDRRDHQHIHRVAVGGQRMRDVAVVAGIVHRGTHEAVDENRAGILVYLIFDRFAVHRDLDDHIEVVGQTLSGWDVIQTHGARPLRGN